MVELMVAQKQGGLLLLPAQRPLRGLGCLPLPAQNCVEDLSACSCLPKDLWVLTAAASQISKIFIHFLFTICRCGGNSALAAAGSTNTKDCMEGLTTRYGLAKDCAENLPVCFYLPKSCKEDLAACFCLPKDCTEDLAACSGP